MRVFEGVPMSPDRAGASRCAQMQVGTTRRCPRIVEEERRRRWVQIGVPATGVGYGDTLLGLFTALGLLLAAPGCRNESELSGDDDTSEADDDTSEADDDTTEDEPLPLAIAIESPPEGSIHDGTEVEVTGTVTGDSPDVSVSG